MSLSILQEAQDRGVILLVGTPGAGKSTFCHNTVLRNMAIDRPVIMVTTEQGPQEVVKLLTDRGLGDKKELNMVDAFTQTVGLECSSGESTMCANCSDLNSMSIAITKLRERTGKKDTLLVLDSLTSPYLFNGMEVIKFMRLFLSKFVSEGNSVIATIDEGCGKEEDIGAMMSVSDGVVKMEMKEDMQLLNVVKHPGLKPERIEAPIEKDSVGLKPSWNFDPDMMRYFMSSYLKGEGLRNETGDYVNLFWPNLAHWSCMLWDPKKFSTMIYDLNKEESSTRESLDYFPLKSKLMIRSLILLGLFPKDFSRVRDMKKYYYWPAPKIERLGTLEYLQDKSKTGEHYFRIHESSDCWGLDDIGTAVSSHIPPYFAGILMFWENGKRDWNAIETKCIGMGDPYCEWKVVPGEISELKDSLEKNIETVEKIYKRLIQHITGFILDSKPLKERPGLGNEIHVHTVMHLMGFPHVAGERYRMAQRMGGVKAGKEIGEQLMARGLNEDEAIKRVFDFMNYCKVGKVTAEDGSIRIKENCESLRTLIVATRIKEPCCYFTTGFLNGIFSAVKKKRVVETKCIVAGDPYCEWEIV
jgi:predicted hydrocarbon binding protein/KaiC/GvpD/RAD55 family RecA-like ATPase